MIVVSEFYLSFSNKLLSLYWHVLVGFVGVVLQKDLLGQFQGSWQLHCCGNIADFIDYSVRLEHFPVAIISRDDELQ